MSNQSTFSTTTVIIIIAGLIVGAGGGYLLSSNSLQPVISDYKTQVAALETEIETLSSTLSTALSEKESIDNQITVLEEQASGMSDEISSLENDNIDLLSQISDLTAQNTEKDSTIADLVSDLEDSEEKVSEKENEIDDLHDDLEYYQSRLGERLGWTVYDRNRVRFEYPSYLEFSDAFSTEENGAGIGYSEEQNTTVIVIWGEPAINETGLDEVLDISMEGFQEAGNFTILNSIRVNSTVLDHKMKYQYFAATDETSEVMSGIYAVWICEDSNRIFIVSIAAMNEDALVLFHRIIDTFACHTGTLGY